MGTEQMTKNYLAIRLRKTLTALAEKAGTDVPLKVSAQMWCQIRMNLMKETTQETRVEYLREGLFGVWNGRMIFIFQQTGEPEPYPEGAKIIEEMDNKRRGRC